jgi:hypothetical protein
LLIAAARGLPSRPTGDHVQVDLRVQTLEVQRGRDEAAVQGQQRDDRLDRSTPCRRNKRADVVRRVRELEDQRDAGIALTSGRGLSVEQWMNLWLDTIASRKVRPSTLAGYRSCLKRINLHVGHHRLDKLQPEHLEAFFARLEAITG